MPARFLPAHPARMHLVLMLVLTFSTGVLDAVGYLGLDRVFTANMTGNVVILGMALLGGDNLPILGPIVALAGFMTGAMISGRALRLSSAGWNRRTTTLLVGVSAVMAVVAILLLTGVNPRHNEVLTVAITGTLAVTMGGQAATARHLNVRDVPTVVVTSTITGLAADSRLGAGTHPPLLGAAACGHRAHHGRRCRRRRFRAAPHWARGAADGAAHPWGRPAGLECHQPALSPTRRGHGDGRTQPGRRRRKT